MMIFLESLSCFKVKNNIRLNKQNVDNLLNFTYSKDV